VAFLRGEKAAAHMYCALFEKNIRHPENFLTSLLGNGKVDMKLLGKRIFFNKISGVRKSGESRTGDLDISSVALLNNGYAVLKSGNESTDHM
jgi:hypothetical protein